MITCINMNICLYLKTVDIETYKNLPSSYHLSNIDSTKTTLRENCSYSELFWSVFFRIRTEYGEIWSICPYSVRMRENTDQNNSEYEHFLHSARFTAKRVSIMKFISKFKTVVWHQFWARTNFTHKQKTHIYHKLKPGFIVPKIVTWWNFTQKARVLPS